MPGRERERDRERERERERGRVLTCLPSDCVEEEREREREREREKKAEAETDRGGGIEYAYMRKATVHLSICLSTYLSSHIFMYSCLLFCLHTYVRVCTRDSRGREHDRSLQRSMKWDEARKSPRAVGFKVPGFFGA